MLPTPRDIRLATADLLHAVGAWRLWVLIGWQDIRQRYRRSVLGPFWLSLGMAINIAAIGLIWANLFRFNRGEFIPYLTIGVLVWFFVTDSLRDGANCFISSAAMIKQMRRPYAMYALLTIWRNVLVFAHHIVVFIGVALIYAVVPSRAVLLLPLAGVMIFASISWAVLLMGMISARFRDVPLVITYALSVLFFVTPVMWKKTQLGAHAYLVDFNPFSHIIDLVRQPLLGGYPQLASWLVVLAIAVVGWTGTFLFFARFRGRIAYWL